MIALRFNTNFKLKVPVNIVSDTFFDVRAQASTPLTIHLNPVTNHAIKLLGLLAAP